MTEIIFVVEEAEEGGFTASAVGAAIVTEADTVAELRERVRDAVLCHFDDGEQPRWIRLRSTCDEIVSIEPHPSAAL